MRAVLARAAELCGSRTPRLNSRHVVFGRVVKGMEVVRLMEKVARDKSDKVIRNSICCLSLPPLPLIPAPTLQPRVPVVIADCGQIGEAVEETAGEAGSAAHAGPAQPELPADAEHPLAAEIASRVRAARRGAEEPVRARRV